MKEHPLPLMPDMVRAYYEGRKTQTRRVLNRNKLYNGFAFDDPRIVRACPYGQPGDRLWIRETLVRRGDYVRYECDQDLVLIDGEPLIWPWKVGKLPSRYMPRWACRSRAELVAVRVERVQDISEADAWAEGAHTIARRLPYSGDDLGRMAFSGLWEQINGPRGYGWDSNPWAWALTFKRIAE